MASLDANLQVYSQIRSRAKEHRKFIVTPVTANVTFRTERQDGRVSKVGYPLVAMTTREVERAS